MISLLAITLALWSIKKPVLPGNAKDQGLVPTTGRLPPLGAIEAGALVVPKPIKPASARAPVCTPSTPQLYERSTFNTAIPYLRAAGIRCSKPIDMAGCAKPLAASTLKAADRGEVIAGIASPSTFPHCTC